MILNVFELDCAGHIAHGLRRSPGNNRHRCTDLTFWTELARFAESGGFTAIFLADAVGADDTHGGSAEMARREGLQIPHNDPMLVVPAMAAAAGRLGVGIIFSTSDDPPCAFARRLPPWTTSPADGWEGTPSPRTCPAPPRRRPAVIPQPRRSWSRRR